MASENKDIVNIDNIKIGNETFRDVKIKDYTKKLPEFMKKNANPEICYDMFKKIATEQFNKFINCDHGFNKENYINIIDGENMIYHMADDAIISQDTRNELILRIYDELLSRPYRKYLLILRNFGKYKNNDEIYKKCIDSREKNVFTILDTDDHEILLSMCKKNESDDFLIVMLIMYFKSKQIILITQDKYDNMLFMYNNVTINGFSEELNIMNKKAREQWLYQQQQQQQWLLKEEWFYQQQQKSKVEGLLRNQEKLQKKRDDSFVEGLVHKQEKELRQKEFLKDLNEQNKQNEQNLQKKHNDAVIEQNEKNNPGKGGFSHKKYKLNIRDL